jgi:membrane associated rhomboid family serine protease
MFFPLPIRVHDGRQFHAIPVVNGLIIVANVLIFCAGWQPSVGTGTGMFSILTYAFGHANLQHLAGNMLALLVFGTPANRRVGNGWYLVIYLGSAMALGLFARVFSSSGLIGSSGAIFAVIAVVALLLPSAKVDIFYFALFPFTVLLGLFKKPQHWVFWFIRWDFLQVRAVWVLLLIPLLELWSLSCCGWNWTNLGHLFGLLCGVAAVLLLPASVSMNRRSAYA